MDRYCLQYLMPRFIRILQFAFESSLIDSTAKNGLHRQAIPFLYDIHHFLEPTITIFGIHCKKNRSPVSIDYNLKAIDQADTFSFVTVPFVIIVTGFYLMIQS